MADESDNVCRVTPFENVDEVLSLLWGDDVKEDIFERWSQGIIIRGRELERSVSDRNYKTERKGQLTFSCLKNIVTHEYMCSLP